MTSQQAVFTTPQVVGNLRNPKLVGFFYLPTPCITWAKKAWRLIALQRRWQKKVAICTSLVLFCGGFSFSFGFWSGYVIFLCSALLCVLERVYAEIQSPRDTSAPTCEYSYHQKMHDDDVSFCHLISMGRVTEIVRSILTTDPKWSWASELDPKPASTEEKANRICRWWVLKLIDGASNLIYFLGVDAHSGRN